MLSSPNVAMKKCEDLQRVHRDAIVLFLIKITLNAIKLA